MRQFSHIKQQQLMVKEVKDKLSQKGLIKATLVTELTLASDIHYHGVVNIQMDPSQKSCAKVRLQNYFRGMKCIGFFNITQINDYEGWIKYLSKDKEYTEQQGLDHVIIDDHSIFEIIPDLPLHLLEEREAGIGRKGNPPHYVTAYVQGTNFLEALDTY